jgi:hypothetical protein
MVGENGDVFLAQWQFSKQPKGEDFVQNQGQESIARLE